MIEAAPLAEPVDGRLTTGLRACRRASKGVLSMAEKGRAGPPPVLVGPAEIAARGEHVAGAGDEQAGQIGVRVDVVDRVADAEVHRRCQTRCAAPVDR